MGIQEVSNLTVPDSVNKVSSEAVNFLVALQTIRPGTMANSATVLAKKGWSSWRPGRSSLWLA
jgi:hypothetical protein